jgi:hypothetical protein
VLSAFEESRAEILLALLELDAECRLADATAHRRAMKIQFLRDRNDVLQIPK